MSGQYYQTRNIPSHKLDMPRSNNQSQGTRWVFTLNNPVQREKDHVAEILLEAKYGVVGREVGESGTPHLQGFVIFHRNKRFNTVAGLFPRAHIELARGSSKQASDYCKKEGDYDEYGECPQPRANHTLDGLYSWADDFVAEHGRAPTSPEIAREHPTAYIRYPRVARALFHRAPPPTIVEGNPSWWQRELDDELNGEASDRSVIFYVDPDGGKGKTWFQQWYLTKNPNEVQVLGIGKRDDLAHVIEITKSVFFFNVPRGGMEHFQYTILEQLKDRMIFSPKYSSCMKILFKKPHVVVFCNEEPEMDKMTADRYDIRRDFPNENPNN